MTISKLKWMLVVFLLAETFFASYGLLMGNHTAVVSILYIFSGLGFICTMLCLPPAKWPSGKEETRHLLLKIPVALAALFVAWIATRYWIFTIPLDPDFADMLPVIKVMNERFIHGQIADIYAPIPEIWNGTRPIYLPAMWLPYSVAVEGGFDLRWISSFFVWLAFIIVLLLIPLGKKNIHGWLCLLTAAVLYWWIFSANEIHGFISMSEEGPVLFYYALLGTAVIARRPWLMGIAAALCMLSRYSLIGWLVPCLICFMAAKENRKALIFSATLVGAFIFLYLLPFGFQTLGQMISLPSGYIHFAKQVWLNSPDVYWLNLGLAKFYGPQHVLSLHRSLITLSLLLPLVFVFYCLRQKRWNLNNVNAATLKFALLVFYQFIDVPYGYLFYTCSMVSLVFAAGLLEGAKDQYLPESSISMSSSR